MAWETPISLTSFPKAIVHIDGDAFFASCEQALHPQYRGKPVITGKERGIVASLSYEAKALGIKRGQTLFEVRKICPSAIIVPSDYETYSLFSKRMFVIMRRFTPTVEEYGIDEGFVDLTGLRRLHHKGYMEIALEMQQTLCRELGFTVSVGLAATKSLAKIASKWKKPHGFTSVANRELSLFLPKVPVEMIWGVGPNTTEYMQKLGIFTAFDFTQKSFSFIKERFTKPHQEIWYELRGTSMYPVNTDVKVTYASISKTRTFTPPSNDAAFVYAQLVKNLENACIKARRYHLVAQKLVIFLKKQDFRTCALEARITRASAYPGELLGILKVLFRRIFVAGVLYRASGVVLLDLRIESGMQTSLFDPPLKLEKMQKLYGAVDELARKFGKHTVHIGASLPAHTFRKHLGERGDIPVRQKQTFHGERGRKRLSIPIML